MFSLVKMSRPPFSIPRLLLAQAFLPAMAGFAYIFSFAFSKAGVALFVSWIFNLSAGFIGVMLVWILLHVEARRYTCLFEDVSRETPDVTPCRTSPPMRVVRTCLARNA